MNKTVLLATHFHSGSLNLMHKLAENPRVQCYRTNNNYDHQSVIEDMEAREHKCHHRGAVYVDEVMLNHSIQSTRIIDICRIIYLIRSPRHTLEGIVSSKMLEPKPAVRYYCYRLLRLCEMARRNTNAVFITHDDLITGQALPHIEDYLYLKEPLRHVPEDYPIKDLRGLIPKQDMEVAERAFEKYLHFFKKLGLRGVDHSQVLSNPE